MGGRWQKKSSRISSWFHHTSFLGLRKTQQVIPSSPPFASFFALCPDKFVKVARALLSISCSAGRKWAKFQIRTAATCSLQRLIVVAPRSLFYSMRFHQYFISLNKYLHFAASWLVQCKTGREETRWSHICSGHTEISVWQNRTWVTAHCCSNERNWYDSSATYDCLHTWIGDARDGYLNLLVVRSIHFTWK